MLLLSLFEKWPRIVPGRRSVSLPNIYRPASLKYPRRETIISKIVFLKNFKVYQGGLSKFSKLS